MVTFLELLPLLRLVPIPFAQTRTRSNLPHPSYRSQCFLSNSTWPKAIHQKSRPFVRRRFVVNPPDSNLKFTAPNPRARSAERFSHLGVHWIFRVRCSEFSVRGSRFHDFKI